MFFKKLNQPALDLPRVYEPFTETILTNVISPQYNIFELIMPVIVIGWIVMFYQYVVYLVNFG